MQFHYVVNYDTDTGKWSYDWEMTDGLDGNVYTDDDGFFWPAPEYPMSEEIDQKCQNILHDLLPTWPEVDHGN